MTCIRTNPVARLAVGLAVALALAGPLALAAAPGATPGQDPEAVADRADRALADLTSLEAEFVQRAENPILEKTEIGHGTLSYRAPDRYRIDYRYPAGDVVVDDGTWVWIFLPSSQPGQVIRRPSGESGATNPLTYLRDLRARYEARLAGADPIGGEVSDHLALSPRADGAPFEAVDVWVGRQTGLLRQVRTRTADGVETAYTFTVLRRNAPLAESRFRFSPPAGVEVFDP